MTPEAHAPTPFEVADALQRSIEALVGDRQRLRAAGASPALLEANRLEIVRRQWELTAALLAARAA
jgi:hypothetical protein